MWVLFESVFAVSLLVSIVVEAVLVPSLKRELQRTGGTSAMWNDAAAGPDELKSFSSEERLAAFVVSSQWDGAEKPPATHSWALRRVSPKPGGTV